MQDLILGIDIGTTGTKCTIYAFDGSIAATAYQEYPMIHPNPGWAEQDPERWWQAVKDNLQACFKGKEIDNNRIAVIGISCTNAVVIVDEKGNPLYNAIGLHDQRATEQVEWLEEHVGSERIGKSSANRLAKGSFALPTLRWLIDNRPELIAKCRNFLLPSGYIIQKLTGVFSINRPRMDLTLLSDIYHGEWDMEIVELAQIPKRILPKSYSSTQIVGEVTEMAAKLTGLRKGIPITAGSIDTVAATIGAGAVNQGDFALTIGSSGRICYISDKPIDDRRLLNIHSAYEEQYVIVQSTDNAGISLRWYRDVFGKALIQQAEAKGKKIYEYIDEIAENAGVGAGGIIYLPYLSGEKSPIWNPYARGVFFNIGLNSDLGCLARAVLEGVAYSIKDCQNLVIKETNKQDYIPIGGGIANSRFWCQIFADVLGCPILQLKSNETETLGDMIIAAQAVNIKEIPYDFGKTMAKSGTMLYPNPANAAFYQEKFIKYKKIYNNLIDCF